jgi:hypothetical protein
MSEIDTQEHGQIWENPIHCAWCGEFNLHHFKVEFFARHEDDELTQETQIELNRGRWANVTVQLVASRRSRNPSSRRTGLIISFSCEHCSGITELHIAQHKGTEYFGLVKGGRRICEDDFWQTAADLEKSVA